MKRCALCGEEFRDEFNFCPVDGETLSVAPGAAPVYRPTIMSDDSLARRLAIQISFLVAECRLVWPRLKADPFQFLRDQFGQMKHRVAWHAGSEICWLVWQYRQS